MVSQCALPGLLGHCAAWYRRVADRIGRKWLISTGMLVQAGALALGGKSTSYGPWIVAVVLLGARDRVALPNPAGCDGRRRPPDLVARAVGIYRPWRDAGFAAGALLAGLIADRYGLTAQEHTGARSQDGSY